MKRPREYSLRSFFLEYIFKIIQARIEERFKSYYTLQGWNELNDYKRLVWKFGYCICSRQDCNCRIQPKNNFSRHSSKVFGKQCICKSCHNKPSNANNNARKNREQKAMEAGTKRKECDTEDMFAQWIQTEFEKYGWEVLILPEARLIDVLVRHKNWPIDTWIGVQLKTDGAYHNDGTLKPDTVNRQKATFAQCDGYVHSNHIQLLFGKFRKQNEKDVVMLWQMSGNEAYNASSSMLYVNMKNEIGYRCGKDGKTFRQTSLSENFQEFFDTCQNLYSDGKIWTYREAFLCIDERNTVCKEVALMIALSENKLINNAELEYPVGNAHIYDCFQMYQSKKYQCKSINLSSGEVSLSHRVNGVQNIRYKKEDDFDSFIFGKLLHKEGKYYVIYLVVEKNTALHFNKGSRMTLQFNNEKIKELLTGSNVNVGLKNKMYDPPNSFPMQLSEIQPSETLPKKLLNIVCDHKM